MLFQGQEFAASAPFFFFADHDPRFRAQTNAGRRKFVRQFPSIDDPAVASRLSDATSPDTFRRCKLDHGERERHAEAYALYRDLLAMRRQDPAFSAQNSSKMQGAVLGECAFLLRFLCDAGDRLLLVNLGLELELRPAPEPLLASPSGTSWQVVWSSEDPKYGGTGAGTVEQRGELRLPARSTHVLVAKERASAPPS
jgi:maltooligosyltrehalose trehalohydrolase